MSRLRRPARAALAERSDLTLIDGTAEKRLFASVEPPHASADLKGAQRSLRKAQKALRNFELDEAQAGYAKTTEILSPVVGFEEAVDLDKERLALGVALAYALRNDDQITERILEGRGRKQDLDTILDVARRGAGTTICAFYDGAVGPYISYIEKFRDEFEALIPK